MSDQGSAICTYDETMLAALKQAGYTVEQAVVLQHTLCKDLHAAEMVLFLTFAHRSGLDPFRRQVYAMKMDEYEGFGADRRKVGSRLVFVTGIDGLRCTAERSGKYLGQTQVMWAGRDGVWKDFWAPEGKDMIPSMAKVGVYRAGAPEPIFAVAHMREFGKYYRTPKGDVIFRGQWATMPAHMISKCAEALALRKALPAELSNLYTPEEVDANERGSPSQPLAEGADLPLASLPQLPPGGSQADKLLKIITANKKPIPTPKRTPTTDDHEYQEGQAGDMPGC